MTIVEIGKKLRLAREARRMTILEVSVALGMGMGTIYRIETGSNDVMFSTIERLSKYVGMTLCCEPEPVFTLETAVAERQQELVDSFNPGGM